MYQTWQLDNVSFKLPGVFGSIPPPVPPTPALWVRWPAIWREHTRPSRLPLVCSAAGTWEAAETTFALLVGQPLTREHFCTHGGAAYPFILNRPRWDRLLPDDKAAATDIKRAALDLAFMEILNDDVTVETLMAWKKSTLPDVLDDYPRARHLFEGRKDFNHLANWIHAVAKNHVRAVMNGIEWPQSVESKPAHVRRKRLRANGECPWCWSDDVAVLTCLALGETGIFRLSSAQAADTIKNIMASKDYNSPDSKKRLLQVARVQILSRIAGRDSQDVPAPVKKQEPMVQTGASTTATVRSEVSKMLADRTHPLNDANAPGHADAVRRFHELTAK